MPVSFLPKSKSDKVKGVISKVKDVDDDDDFSYGNNYYEIKSKLRTIITSC